MADRERLSAAEYDALRPKLGRHTVDTVKLGREVFVNGKSQSEVAIKYGCSRQRVHMIVRRIREVIADVPPTWEKVNVYLPPEDAEHVREMAIAARKRMYEQSAQHDSES